MSTELDIAAVEAVRVLQQAGYTAYWAGGCVRDRLMGREPKDYDIASDAPAARVEELFEDTRDIGRAFGVTLINHLGHPFEVAAFRKEADYEDGRHPSRVEPSSPEEDTSRRDFTINGIFFDPITERVIDFVDGQADIAAGIIRAIGDPEERFREDHLRMLRAARFAGSLGFEIEAATADAIRALAPRITRISMERIHDELNRLLLESAQAGQAFAQLHELGLLQELIPEALPMIGCEQPPRWHPEGDVWTHTMIMLDMMDDARSRHLAWGILFHDIGKPPTAEMGTDKDGSPRIRFNGHAQVGADMARAIMRRLKFSNEDIDAVTHIVNNHMTFMAVKEMKKSTLRKFVSKQTFPDELKLHRIDCASSNGFTENFDFLVDYLENFEEDPVLPDPLVTGRDIMDLGVPEGREIGRWKNDVFDKQLSEPERSREELLAWVAERIRSSED